MVMIDELLYILPFCGVESTLFGIPASVFAVATYSPYPSHTVRIFSTFACLADIDLPNGVARLAPFSRHEAPTLCSKIFQPGYSASCRFFPLHSMYSD